MAEEIPALNLGSEWSTLRLTKHLVAVKHSLALFLDLLLPALLCPLNPLQHCVSSGLAAA